MARGESLSQQHSHAYAHPSITGNMVFQRLLHMRRCHAMLALCFGDGEKSVSCRGRYKCK